MKKKLAIILSGMLLLNLTACGEEENKKIKTGKVADESIVTKDKVEIESSLQSESSAQSENSYETESSSTVDSGTPLDPFDKMKVTFMGASPFLKVNIDTSLCSEEEQQYVNFDFEDKYYKLGDTVNIKAVLNTDNTGENTYHLVEDSKDYAVEDAPEYLTSLDGVNTKQLDQEISDKLASETTQTVGAESYGGQSLGLYKITSVEKTQLKSVYLITLKPTFNSDFDQDSDVYNYYIKLYTTNLHWKFYDERGKNTISSCVILKNVKKDADGNLTYDPNLDYASSKDNYEQLLNDQVTAKRDKYNVSKIK